MGILNPGRFISVANFQSMAFLFPELALLSFAMMLAMLTGGIDLSIVSIANLSGILAALILTRLFPENAGAGATISSIFLAVLAAAVCGAACGAFNGLLISRVRISPILVTLGTMQVYMGLALVITNGRAVFGYPSAFLMLGNETLWGVPVPFFYFLVLAIILALISNRTVFGMQQRLLGSNPVAALFSGISASSVLFRTYLMTGTIAGLTGILMIARTNSAKADYGTSYLLQAILVAVLGGVHPAGGFGTVMGISVAVLALQFLASGFNMLQFSNFAKEFIWGAFLLLSMVINYVENNRGNK
jgi:simple sugar transport system permease protein